MNSRCQVGLCLRDIGFYVPASVNLLSVYDHLLGYSHQCLHGIWLSGCHFLIFLVDFYFSYFIILSMEISNKFRVQIVAMVGVHI